MSVALSQKSSTTHTGVWIALGAGLVLALTATLLHDTIFHHGMLLTAAADKAPPPSEPAAMATSVSLPEGKFKAAKIATARAERVELTSAIDVAGRIDANIDRRVEIRPRASGVVRQVEVTFGQKVKKGDVLAILDSPDIGTARLNLWAKQRDLGVAQNEADWKSEIAGNVAKLIPELRKRARNLRVEAGAMHAGHTDAHEGTQDLNEGTKADDIERRYADLPLGAYRGSLLSAYAEFLIAAHEEEKTTGLHKANVVGEHPYFLSIHTRKSAQAKVEGVLEQVRFDAAQEEKLARNKVRFAEGEVVDAAQRLRILGVSEDISKLLADAHKSVAAADPSASLAAADVTAYRIVAPFDGTIVDKSVTPSQKAEMNDRLFILANLSNVWVQANIPESDFPLIPTLQNGTIHVTAAAYPDRAFDARLISIGSVVDEKTRTVSLLAETKNPDDLLKLGMFVRIVLDTTSKSTVLTVPSSAVVEIEKRKGVFVPSGEDGRTFSFHPVKVGRRSEGRQVILSGLEQGATVVTDGAFQLKSELILQNETEEE